MHAIVDREVVRPKFLWRLASVSVAMAFAGATLTPAPAQAEVFTSTIRTSVGMYDCTSSSTLCTTKVTTADAGVKARMVCWEEGRTADNQRKWFYVRLANGRQGFVPAPRVSSQTTVKSCRDTNASNEIDGVVAANWALGRNGQVTVPQADQDKLASVWGLPRNHTAGDWSGDCISFAALGWYSAGTKIPLRNARQVYDHYKTLGKVKSGTNPTRGALVFWNSYSNGINYGHVEISLGNGRSIGTQGWDGQRLPISIARISTSNYLGWAMP